MREVLGRARRGWLRTHWKVLVAIWLGLSFSGGAIAFVWLHNSDAARMSIAKAESSPALIAQLGRPIETGWFISGNIEVQPGTGHAELSIPISGPKGKGTLYSEARKEAGIWHLLALQYGADGSDDRLDLLADPDTNPAGNSR